MLFRSSKNKQPYKTNGGAVLTRTGAKGSPGIVYTHISPEGGFFAAGFYHPEPEQLAAFRQAIAKKPQTFLAMEKKLASAKLEIVDREALWVFGFNFTGIDIRSRSFGVVSRDRKVVAEALRLFESDSLRQDFEPETDGFVVSPENAREQLAAARLAAIEVLKSRHDDEEDVTVVTQDSMLETFSKLLSVLTTALVGIAAISLSVAGHARVAGGAPATGSHGCSPPVAPRRAGLHRQCAPAEASRPGPSPTTPTAHAPHRPLPPSAVAGDRPQSGPGLGLGPQRSPAADRTAGALSGASTRRSRGVAPAWDNPGPS